ncbi:MAG TPA: tRNA (adenosine(37)-N6)-threonylcarbamoyltransferase complex ATPase subunit type 1 TsaE [Acidimicrobiia bacterium]|nr:tRNA (adenosine(37)-N6)-threonylcarbamoyltransferase complex ATPase subunit type 1 TsaE [Acidimicrobiia bacterium]
MSDVTVVAGTADATRTVGRCLAPLLRVGDVVVVAGGLGAGKTTFTQGLATGLGVTDSVVSPTFTLAREYEGRLRLVHVDLYRLDRAQEVLDLGLEDLADDAVLVVEWGDVAAAYLNPEHLEVRLTPAVGTEAAADEQRMIAITCHGRSWMPRADALAAAVGGT